MRLTQVLKCSLHSDVRKWHLLSILNCLLTKISLCVSADSVRCLELTNVIIAYNQIQDSWAHLIMSLLHPDDALIYKQWDTGMRQSSMAMCLISTLKDGLITLFCTSVSKCLLLFMWILLYLSGSEVMLSLIKPLVLYIATSVVLSTYFCCEEMNVVYGPRQATENAVEFFIL